jgi:hypothetical protein
MAYDPLDWEEPDPGFDPSDLLGDGDADLDRESQDALEARGAYGPPRCRHGHDPEGCADCGSEGAEDRWARGEW